MWQRQVMEGEIEVEEGALGLPQDVPPAARAVAGS
jgi:hypothetical protein